MPRDAAIDALHRLHVAHANYEVASEAKAATRKLLDEAIILADQAGLSKAEIGRATKTTGQRVNQILSRQA